MFFHKGYPGGLKLILSIAITATSVSLLAQSSTPDEQGPPTDIVTLSQFEVTTTQGHGYVYDNSVSAFKTKQALLDIPQLDTVITRDLINDIGFASSTAITQYFGAGSTYSPSENTYMRGARITYPYVDEMPQNASYEDNVWVDSYELIKGPAQVLYLNTFLSGTELKTSKVPLPYQQDIVTASINSWGTYRATFDSTGPIGTIGGVKIAYRLVGAYQSGTYYFVNYKDDREVIFPEVSAKWRNTSFRTYYTLEKLFGPVNRGEGILTPGGDLFTGAGRRINGGTPGNTMKYENNRFYGEMLEKISDSSENRLKVGMTRNQRYLLGSETFPNVVNWAAQTETWDAREDNFRNGHWTILDDFQTHYDLGSLRNSDIVGFGYDDYTSEQREWSADNFGWNKVTVPINSAPALNFYTPSWQDYDAHISDYPNQGVHTETAVYSIYGSHSINITDYFSLTAGWSWSGITNYSTSNISAIPWQTTTVPIQQYLHRYGAVFKPTPAVSIYAFNATTFNPNGIGSTPTYAGLLPPPNVGKGSELGFKTALFGGRLSSDFAWFRMATTNIYQYGAGLNPEGFTYAVLAGDSVQEGFDGDLALSLVRGWQVIGSFYAGHDRDQFDKPLAGSYDNSWSLLTRYDFQPGSRLHGLVLGAGTVRFGGRWAATTAYIDAPYTAYNLWSGEVKAKTGTSLNAFASYYLSKHWMLKLNCDNVLDQIYAQGAVQLNTVSPADPRTFIIEVDYKF